MSDIASLLLNQAPILHRSANEICFQVDHVEPCQERLASTKARSKLEEKTGRSLLACSHDDSCTVVGVREVGEHAFVNAVHLAFSEHRPMVFTPDTVWMTLAQGFAQHVNNHAEALRSRLVQHKGKVTLEAEAKVLAEPQHWIHVIEQWGSAIKRHVGVNLYDLMICDFSTTTPTVRTASQVVMMDAFQQYFDYHLICICGIPSITLQGSVDDWIRIRERVDLMEGYHLEWWTDRLKPLCDAFVETAKGAPSLSFWRHIYKPKEIYGGEVITGWLADLFPYVQDPITHAPTVRNPILETPRHELRAEQGLRPEMLPTGISQAPFKLKITDKPGAQELDLVAGFIGVTQDSMSGKLQPEIGWAVLEEHGFSRLLDELVPVHEQRNPPGKSLFPAPFGGVPKELIQLMDRAGAEYTFFAGTTHSWRLKIVATLPTQVLVGTGSIQTATHFMELTDGRQIAYLPMYGFKELSQEWWIIVGRLQSDGFMAIQTVIAKGIPQLLERMASSRGRYYFDDPDFVSDGFL